MITQGSKGIIYVEAILFVLFFLKASSATAQVRDVGIAAEAPMEDYSGSDACAECHQGKYEDWSRKHMSHFVRYRRDISESLPGNWHNSPINGDEVFLIVGNRSKVAFVDKNWKVFPYLYHVRKQRWIMRSVWAYQDYRVRCGPCHTVGLNRKTKRFIENNVGCETCHGPGREHAKDPEQKDLKVPGKTDGHNVLFTCRRCHDERGKHARAIKHFNGAFHSSTP